MPRTPKFSENNYRDLLAQELGGDIEFMTPVGRPDIVTLDEVIEVKPAKQWKAALGQVLAYSYYFPDLSRRLHLIGAVSPEYKELVETHCQRFEVSVSWVEVEIAQQALLTVYLEPELKEKLAAWAKAEKRSMAFLAAAAIEKAVHDWESSKNRL